MRFWLCRMDSGSKALGPDQTISGKVQETLANATAQARAVDEQRGYSKQANDVSCPSFPEK